MQHVTLALQTRLQKKGFTKQSIGAYALHVLRKYSVKPELLGGYVRHRTLFVLLDQKEDKTKWFLHKNDYLEEVNEALQGFSMLYSIEDIRLKQVG